MTSTTQTQPLYLNGAWTDGDGQIEVENPAKGETFASVATVSRNEVRRALSDAQAALPGWRETTALERGDFLLAVAELLQQRADQIARLITLENGKPFDQSKGEVAMSVDHLRWFAEQGRRAYGRMVPNQAPGKRHMVVQQPIGVVGAISPWNFPLVLAVRKVAPALAAGCPVLLKPASQTPLCAVELARAMHDAKMPAGVFQLAVGRASEIGAEMLENPICRKVTFTGSTEVGKKLIQGAATTVTKLSLELGGHAPVLVFEDAELDTAVEGAAKAKFRNNGQSCIAANRLYVQQGIYDEFVDRFTKRVKQATVGDGLSEEVEVGAMIDQNGLDTALDHIRDAQQHGASLVTGGNRIGEKGYFLEPTLLTHVPDKARGMHEETFAPVAPLTSFDTEDEAIERANDTDYGLSAYAFTTNLNRAMRVAERLEAGTVGINDGVPSTSICPFGGMKESGWGRELGDEGLEAFLETKHVSFGGVEQ